MLYSNSRNDTRQMFFDVWQKLQTDTPLTALETIVGDIIRLHPEYHALLEQPENSLNRDWRPEQGETNPFLHMGMHIAIREQLSIDRPVGVKAAYEALLARIGDAHATEHEMLECLGEALWLAQREGRLPDEQAYLTNLNARVKK